MNKKDKIIAAVVAVVALVLIYVVMFYHMPRAGDSYNFVVKINPPEVGAFLGAQKVCSEGYIKKEAKNFTLNVCSFMYISIEEDGTWQLQCSCIMD